MQEMISQKVRTLSPEIDPLRMGMGQTEADLEKPQVMVESTFGDSHPGSAHLLCLVEAAAAGVRSAGGNPARYFATDICDGMAQGHDGINYSLASREIIADAIEIHGMATPFDATVYIASCDKGLPANLMASGRLNTPGIFVPGGVMDAGPDLLTLEQIGTYSAQYERGEITAEQFRFYKTHACPSCGACSFMGTACTMQMMTEALGLSLPGSALVPAASPFYVGYMEVSYELGLARFSGIEGTTEYTEAWEMFIQRLQKQIEQVRAQRQEHHAPQLLTEADCIRDSRAGDYEGKVLVMRPGVLRPEYWNAAHQLYFAVGGNGARAGSHGTKVFCINIYTGEHTYIRRTDVMGAVKPDRLPGWAKEKAAALRQDYQREKAAEKQRLEEFLTARREKETSETLRRPRAAQTRGKEKGGER